MVGKIAIVRKPTPLMGIPRDAVPQLAELEEERPVRRSGRDEPPAPAGEGDASPSPPPTPKRGLAREVRGAGGAIREERVTLREGRAPLLRKRRKTTGGGAAGREERIRSAGRISAVGTARPEQVRKTPEPIDRARATVRSLRACGPGDEQPAIQALLRLDPEVVLPVVAKEFPGLLWFHRHLKHRKLPKGRATGPLGATLVAFGGPAVPTVVQLLEDRVADRRYYAALVGGDLLCGEGGAPLDAAGVGLLVEALGARLFDRDQGVRDAALHALMNALESEAIAALGERLRSYVGDRSVSPSTRLAALRALGVLRHVPVVDDAIAMLDDPSPEMQDAARRVLRVICGADRGPSRRRWASWWKKHTKRSRGEWLVEGLLDRDEKVRSIAHRELVRLTGEDLAFDPVASKRERKKVAAAYRELL
ncbi:MAG: hypothetical protein CMN29_01685 [Sandaracinus sp.]|nr:hypothetical protein [Sandaracinus sp.]